MRFFWLVWEAVRSIKAQDLCALPDSSVDVFDVPSATVRGLQYTKILAISEALSDRSNSISFSYFHIAKIRQLYLGENPTSTWETRFKVEWIVRIFWGSVRISTIGYNYGYLYPNMAMFTWFMPYIRVLCGARDRAIRARAHMRTTHKPSTTNKLWSPTLLIWLRLMMKITI